MTARFFYLPSCCVHFVALSQSAERRTNVLETERGITFLSRGAA